MIRVSNTTQSFTSYPSDHGLTIRVQKSSQYTESQTQDLIEAKRIIRVAIPRWMSWYISRVKVPKNQAIRVLIHMMRKTTNFKQNPHFHQPYTLNLWCLLGSVNHEWTMHMNEVWMGIYESQFIGLMKRWKGEGKFWGMTKPILEMKMWRKFEMERDEWIQDFLFLLQVSSSSQASSFPKFLFY